MSSHSQADLLGFSIGSFVAQQIPRVIGAIGTPETSPQAYLGVFFTQSASSQQAGTEALRRMYARTEDRDKATTWATREAQYDAVCTWEIPDHAVLQRVSAIGMPVFDIRDRGSNLLSGRV